ncbi:MAG: crosslink repair DNA glycosylase YcaQ family protein [Pseudomonadota bacterium]
MKSRLRITNRTARRLWLAAQGLSNTPTGKLDLDGLIKHLGFVQLDSIQVVTRAHHHILWSRNQNYREDMLHTHMSRDRRVFEHFTHDASVIPMDFYPMWTRQFRRLEKRVRAWEWHRAMSPKAERQAIKARIETEGPLSTKAFDSKVPGAKQMWSRPPHKLALDYLWYAGELSTSYRKNFTKYYDLTSRVIPNLYLEQAHSDARQVDWLCQAALDRLAFGTEGDIQKFWDAVDNAEAKDWVARNARTLVQVEIEGADRSWRPAWASGDIEERIGEAPAATSRLRILNPFDPTIRNRERLKRLFGFEYTVEMFVPAAKRRWGYYVYPMLEGDRFVGRIEIKADRKSGTLDVVNFWPEPGVQWTAARERKLESELRRMAVLVAAKEIVWSC